jgi:hypothetical protein
MNIQRKISAEQDPNEKSRLMKQLSEADERLKREVDEELRNQDKILEERRRRKADRMAIRKMRIEHDQLTDVLTKELNLNTSKFQDQIN